MAELETTNTIARETVEELSSKFSEPDWLVEKRIAAWEAYFKTAMPSQRDEGWRQTDLSRLDLTGLKTANIPCARVVDIEELGKDKALLPGWLWQALMHFEKRSGLIYQSSEGSVCFQDKELEKKGLIFCDMASAIAKHPDKLRELLAEETALTPGAEPGGTPDNKFTLLSRALFNCGLFLYVPKNLGLDKPFIFALDPGKKEAEAVLPLNVIRAESGSQMTLVYLLGPGVSAEPQEGSAQPETISLLSQNTEIQVKANALLRYLEVQEQGRDVFLINRSNSQVDNDARLESLTLALGSYQTKTDMSTTLKAPGASSQILGVVLGAGEERFSFNTIQEHAAPDTKSDINFRVALKDKSSSVYQGIVKVDKIAQRTDAYQSNKNLLLDAGAKADSNPKLEILADDVKCSHGATVGPVDREQIFYLMSRGISRSIAEQLVVLGFFRQTLETFPFKDGLNWLSSAVSGKIHGIASDCSAADFFQEIEEEETGRCSG